MRILTWLFFSAFSISTFAQKSQPANSSEIYHKLQKLNTLGSVLYIAAHPDDENTRLISWLANDKKYETAYLSLTRGDGGQNLIGSEKWEYMGLLRTHELLEARKIDGGTQFFSRAVDFGYSKTAEETLEKWNEEHILFDMVWVIRKFQPDMLITRFPPNNYGGHGHHIASAILAEKAFDMAADPKAFPEQLKYVTTWQAKSLYFNNSTWWDKSLAEKASSNPEILQLNVGTFNSSLGKWHNQIAMESRSMHKSQGFGTSILRGEQIEYLTPVKGERYTEAILESTDISWNRIPKGEDIQVRLNQVISSYDFKNPASSLPDLLEIYASLEKLESSVWVTRKMEALKNIITDVTASFIEVTSDAPYGIAGDSCTFTLRTVNGTENVNIKINNITLFGRTETFKEDIISSSFNSTDVRVKIPKDQPISQPYWLRAPFVNEFKTPQPWQDYTGLPVKRELIAQVQIAIEDKNLLLDFPIRHRYVDRAIGELYTDFIIAPKFTANPSDEMLLVKNQKKESVSLDIRSFSTGNISVVPETPNGWEVIPEKVNLSFDQANLVKTISFEINPKENAERGTVEWVIKDGKTTSQRGYKTIEYSHIDKLTAFPTSKTDLIPLDLEIPDVKVAYIPGTGDEVASYLERIGMPVTIIDASEVSSANLSNFDAVVLGIRAYNKHEDLAAAQEKLHKYVENGGHLLVQYNTNRGLKVEQIGPYKIRVSRDRVTMEDAKATLLNPNHRILKYPNSITDADFDNWVQERGLYFADEWHENCTPIISWHDKGETPKEGGLLVTNYGKGSYIYTGISFFRQLPAGVPGAFKLLVNLVAYEQVESTAKEKP